MGKNHPIDDDYCFACGSLNPVGLGLKFGWEDDTQECLTATLAPSYLFQGFSGVFHGGLSATVLDDLMSNHASKITKLFAMTASLELRYKGRVHVNKKLIAKSRIVKKSVNLCIVSGELYEEGNSSPLVTATGKFFLIPPEEVFKNENSS